ncbi:MAG TPA: MBOAT family O-acyltransferase [Polyangia bacterium]|nr:MBOAT family O-acyltransferase [Polyangia bacterium]
MLFNSLEFLVFLPCILALYYALPHKAQNRMLLAASCFFYASWDWRFLAPLLVSTTIDYQVASKLEALHRAGAPRERLRPYLLVSLITNLGLLGFFKYYNFFVDTLQTLLQSMGLDVPLPTLRIILPVGISFYTFQALSYTIDVYRGQFHATRSFADFLLAVLYFPHLVAGPIQRANSLLPQVASPRQITPEKLASGMSLIVWGYFKKVFIADNLAPIANQVFHHGDAPGGQVLLATYAFAFQIYCDFSGYTDIARGVARLMGFEFMLNFNLPYVSTSPKEFWNRWHISLSSWLRDYLYIGLGGNRGGTWKTYRNLLLTMVIGGFWHGAAWTFLLWGFYQGMLLVLHRALEPWLGRHFTARSSGGRAVSFVVRVLFMFQLTAYGWLIFRAESVGQLGHFTRALVHPLAGWDGATARTIVGYVLPLVAVQALQYVRGQLDFMGLPPLPAPARWVLYSVLIYFVLFHGGQPESFIYFQF